MKTVRLLHKFRPWAHSAQNDAVKADTNLLILGVVYALLAGCTQVPTVGPSREEITKSAGAAGSALQIIDINDAVVRQLMARTVQASFADKFGLASDTSGKLGTGDVLELSIWEAPPAALFGNTDLGSRAGPGITTARASALPEQTVDAQGRINVPFAGIIDTTGRNTTQVAEEIVRKLKGKANQPQVFVKLVRNASSVVTVTGDVTASARLPLTPRGERVLDAIAAAGGAKAATNKTTVRLTRGAVTVAMPLETVIRDPLQNIPLRAGDIITALHQPLSFTALGATGKNDEVSFETQGISLAQALSRLGGLQDTRSDPQGVFVFRYETTDTLAWPKQPLITTKDGLVPVIYRINLKDANSFFVAQNFRMENKDLIYVSTSPIAEIQKFANLIYTIVLPALSTISAVK
jgi:polysaccharide biosynthesis/export protein